MSKQNDKIVNTSGIKSLPVLYKEEIIDKLKKYEAYKRRLIRRNLSPTEYERQIKKIAKKLGV
ncbi:hypothetical protein AKJ59_00840 [candidate division MSBL1 archaeon SCGC-AAA385M02]|uniref:Uncharacterized protein n=1 Tax=candidate division MSBL1 archaeon SCGC-AAA385M02 TaxID=1698287 RepID=A0A133VPX6_9EURY|nr:hypothetical protein AKJ59_00840 [candidate division MSBL1 archaeon SCGC-AAA385M02]